MTDPAPQERSFWRGRADWWHRVFAADLERLSGEIEKLSIALDMVQPAEVKSRAAAYLKHAEQQRDRGRVNVAWPSLKAARRELIDTYDDATLKVAADEIRRESTEKLGDGWRKNAITTALPTSGRIAESTPEADLRVRVKEAARLLDEHHDNVYKKIDILRRHVMAAGIALVIFLGLVLAIAPETAPATDASPLIPDRPTVFATMILGALGAALSGVLAPLSSDRRERIPDASAQSYLVWVRPFVGAAAAIVVVAVLRAGVGGVTVNPDALPVAALAAGFSERLVGQSVAVATSALAK
jgi:hypothetical protein